MEPRLGWPTWVGVVVDDLDGQAAFYEALGFRRAAHGPGWIHFDFEGRTFELLERSAASEYDSRRYQVGFDVADIEAARLAVEAAGATRISPIEGDVGDDRWCYFRDPEGNVFEITQRRPR